jgi:MFS family permease
MTYSDLFSCPYQAAAWCALNGVGLALVMPCVQSIIAEVYRAKSRGRAFGIIFTTSAFGEPLNAFNTDSCFFSF